MTAPDGLTAESERLLDALPVSLALWMKPRLAVIEAATVARHVRETGGDGLREALAALMRKWGQHSGGCCTFDESGAVVVTPESCVCRDPERTAHRLLGMYGRPDGAALAPTVAAVKVKDCACNESSNCFAHPNAPSPATEAERRGGEG